MMPPSLANLVALDPSGVTSEMYAWNVADMVENPPKSPSIVGPINKDRYPPGARYG
jgi:hypothetical protein